MSVVSVEATPINTDYLLSLELLVTELTDEESKERIKGIN